MEELISSFPQQWQELIGLLLAPIVWIPRTQLSVYTLPFRNSRVHFMSAMLLAWWDAARATWLYWTGLVRCVAVACGWLLVVVGFLVRLIVEALRQAATMPFMMSRMGQRYFQP